jgi:hypothetical protein
MTICMWLSESMSHDQTVLLRGGLTDCKALDLNPNFLYVTGTVVCVLNVSNLSHLKNTISQTKSYLLFCPRIGLCDDEDVKR